MKRLLIFVGQPIYSLKDTCLGSGTVEKLVIFGVQKDVFAQKGGFEIKNRKSNRFNSTVKPPRDVLSDFYRTAIIGKQFRYLLKQSLIKTPVSPKPLCFEDTGK